jgi:hypothetical protein
MWEKDPCNSVITRALMNADAAHTAAIEAIRRKNRLVDPADKALQC